MKQREEMAAMSLRRAGAAAPSRPGRPRASARQVPADDAIRAWLDGADDRVQVQRQPVDPGYGDVVEAARSTTARQVASADDAKKAKAASPPCKKGCAQRWGQDTTCSKWGFRMGEAEHAPHFVVDTAKARKPKSVKEMLVPCCNSWPFSVEDHARRVLGLNGAASCPAQHERTIATVGFHDKQVQVLCSDTIPGAMVGSTNDPGDCTGKVTSEILEMSPMAMQDLSGQLGNALHVSVCFSSTKQDLCLHDGPGKASSPEVEDCLTRGCSPDPGTPKRKDTGWPRA